tara:strand:+ start:149 stop:1792 length:1644 start_codon:yes stop_codon:yes gene_type:complete
MQQTFDPIALIKEGVSDRISKAIRYSKELNMHVTGLGVEEYTEIFNKYESLDNRELREELLKSNKSVFSFLLRPLDKIFTAKGGSISYNLQDNRLETLKDYVSDISDGLDIKTYLKKKVKAQYVIDPNGLVMIDIDNEGNLDTRIIRSSQIHYYNNRGNKIKEIIFAPYKDDTDDKDTKEYYRVIDSLTDSIYIKEGDEVFLDESSVIQNFLGYVPAFILGDTYDPNSELFLSIIDCVLEDANEHLRDVSVKVVHKLSHGYAKYWQYPESCTTCGGEGEIKSKNDSNAVIDIICPTCLGGKVKNHKDASDLTIVAIPDKDDPILAPNIAGYINPSIEIWQQYKEDIIGLKNEMHQTLWGNYFSENTKNETATGRQLNVQPETERIVGISNTFSSIHEFLLTAYGAIALFDKNYKAQVKYGTRYLMESPDEVLKRYTEAKEKGLPQLVQNDLLDVFYQTQHSNNNVEYQKIKKLLATDPFPDLTPTEVKDLGVEGEDLLKKIYHSQWINQLNEAKKVFMTLEELNKDLTEYVILKSINNVKEVQQTTD